MKIKNPLPGKWKAKVKGVDIPSGKEKFQFKIYGDSEISVSAENTRYNYRIGEPIRLALKIYGNVERSSLLLQATVLLPDSTLQTLPPSKDLSLVYYKTSTPGVYLFHIKISGKTLSGEPFTREILQDVVVSEKGAEFGRGKVLKAVGAYVEINVGKEVGARPGMKVFIYDRGKNLVAEGYIISTYSGKSTVELTSFRGTTAPKPGFTIELERKEGR